MNITQIKAMPTVIDEIPAGAVGAHESVLRSYHVVRKVRELLARGVPGDVVIELIDEMTDGAYVE